MALSGATEARSSATSLNFVREAGAMVVFGVLRSVPRKRAPIWPWVAAGIGLVAVVGAIAAYFAWMRKPAWDSAGDAWSTSTAVPADDVIGTETDDLTSGSTKKSSQI